MIPIEDIPIWGWFLLMGIVLAAWVLYLAWALHPNSEGKL